MAITVTHSKVSTIPDGDDSSLIRPSDWNDDHVLVGTIPVDNGGTGASTLTGYVKGNGTSAMTAAATIPNTDITGLGTASTKDAGVALGVATLDSAGKVPISQIPDAVIGALNYQGTWNASTNTPTLTSSVGTKGYYYVVSVAGTTNLNGITDWQIGDWAVYNGTAWQKIDNTDGVTSVNGYTGAVTLTYTDVGAFPATATTGTGNVVLATNPTIANPNIDVVDFDTAYTTALTAGQLGWDGNNTLGLGMAGGNVTQHIGEDSFFYVKASSTITKGQVIMFTGAVGASAVVTGAPATGVSDGSYIMGIAAENIANNAFGLVQNFGTLRNINTSGYADGDILWYNPAVTGGLTKTQPTAPNVKVQMAAVLNGGSSGGGSILIRVNSGSTLGGTDSNAQITSVTNGQLLTYDGADGYWKNTDLASGTGISVGTASNGVLTVTNSLPDQTVALANGTGISVTGTYPNFTITNTAPSSGGTVTSVTATAPVASTGGTTPVISMPAATASVSGYLTSTDWNTFNNKSNTNGTVTSVAALTIGTTGTDLSSSVANSTTTPVITLNVPTASATNRGALSAADWTTFNNKTSNLGTVTSVSGTGTVNGLTLTGTVTTSGSLTLGGTLDLSSPPAIGGTTAAAITGTTITATKFVGVSGGTF